MSRRKILIVLDLNGTLIDRLAKGPERVAANRNPLCPKEADLTLNKNKVFLRPYLDVFLKFLFENFHVSAWTSATPKNSVPLVDFIFEPFGANYGLGLFHNRDRDKCIIEPTPEKEYNSVKDLTKIWLDNSTRNPDAVNVEGIWNEHNTILVDDSACKSCRTPLNHLLVPTFSVGDLKLTRNCDQDTTLLSAVSYLRSMQESHVKAESNCTNWSVQEFIKTTPLYIEAEDSTVYLRNEHIVFPSHEEWVKRHRVSESREMLGAAAFSSPEQPKKASRWNNAAPYSVPTKTWVERESGSNRWKEHGRNTGAGDSTTVNSNAMDRTVNGSGIERGNGVVEGEPMDVEQVVVHSDGLLAEDGGNAKKPKKKKSKSKKKLSEAMMSQDESEGGMAGNEKQKQEQDEQDQEQQKRKRESCEIS
ncbi:UNVERIFIED_CONTAM: hypothetical protein HDU68_006074 [Siphonaria sp. JEL0065]|nr:hypothetical protein HDU68_006074 [Siphonaria sp. JEL0065]